MKKRILILIAIAVVSVVVASCTHHTCPAYRGSVAMAEEVE